MAATDRISYARAQSSSFPVPPVRLLLACLLAPLTPLLAFYGLSLLLDGPAPVLAAEPSRVAFNAVPALLLAYPWCWLIATPPLVWLRHRGHATWLAAAIAGFVAGAAPAVIGALRSPALDAVPAAIVFGVMGLIFGVGFRALAGRPRDPSLA